jgi:hypothetical protein
MEDNSIIGAIPWPVAIATALWFGFMAYKSGKSLVLWAIGGGLLGLIVTTIVLGLGQATFIPSYAAEIAPFRFKATALAILIVAGVGWLFTGTLHRRLLSLEKPSATPATPAAMPAPPALSRKV